jgi:hypothetical protein
VQCFISGWIPNMMPILPGFARAPVFPGRKVRAAGYGHVRVTGDGDGSGPASQAVGMDDTGNSGSLRRDRWP